MKMSGFKDPLILLKDLQFKKMKEGNKNENINHKRRIY